MVNQTYYLLFLNNPPFSLIAFVFFSTICSYNFHWYLTPNSLTSSVRSKWTQQHKQIHLFFYILGLTGSLIYFFFLRTHWIALAFAAFVTFLYSAPKLPQNLFKELKNIAIGKTIFLAFVWMFVTTMLPVFVEGKPMKIEHFLFACSRFFLIYSICIIFDFRDRDDDKNDGIKSLVTYLNEKGINRIFIISLILFLASTGALYWFQYSPATIVVLLLPGLITAALYSYAKKNFSDYLYYFVLDGMMMFSGLLMLIFRI